MATVNCQFPNKLKISAFMFKRRKKFIQVWNNLRTNKGLQNYHFVNYPFNLFLWYIILIISGLVFVYFQPDARYFRVDLHNSGKVVLNKSLDYEIKTQLRLTLYAVVKQTENTGLVMIKTELLFTQMLMWL